MPVIMPRQTPAKNLRTVVVPGQKKSGNTNTNMSSSSTYGANKSSVFTIRKNGNPKGSLKPAPAGVKRASPKASPLIKKSPAKRAVLSTSARIIRGTTPATSGELSKHGFMPMSVIAAPAPKPEVRAVTPPPPQPMRSPEPMDTEEPLDAEEPMDTEAPMDIEEPVANEEPMDIEEPIYKKTYDINECLRAIRHSPSSAVTDGLEPPPTPRALFETSLRSLQGFDFGQGINLTKHRMSLFARAFGFNKTGIENYGDKADAALSNFLFEVVWLCEARGREYMNREFLNGASAWDHERFFFGKVCRDLFHRHKNDRSWAETYDMAGLGFDDTRELVNIALGARLNYLTNGCDDCRMDVETRLTYVVDQWARVWRKAVEFY